MERVRNGDGSPTVSSTMARTNGSNVGSWNERRFWVPGEKIKVGTGAEWQVAGAEDERAVEVGGGHRRGV